MKQRSRIPVVRGGTEDLLPGNPFAKVVLSSASTSWRDLVLEEHHFAGGFELENLMYIQHVIGVNVGEPITCEYRRAGYYKRVNKRKDAVFFSPSHQPLFQRLEGDKKKSAKAVYLALDPVFFNQTAEGLGVNPDRVELVGQQREADPNLQHITMALRAGVEAGHGSDRMYGEALSTALVVHLLRDYNGKPVKPRQRVRGGLPKNKLSRAIEFIHDQLRTDLTVADIARTAHMSSHHFTLLFKQSTGQSPYQYVIEARAQKAKELLASGKFSIAEIAHETGFADQSHLTRNLKHFFGVTPKMLLNGRYGAKDSSKEPEEYSRSLWA